MLGAPPRVAAQDASWRPAARSEPAPTAANATLGRPVAITRASSADLDRAPRPYPAPYRTGTDYPPARQASSAQAIATVAPPGAVIAASAQSAPPTPLPPSAFMDPEDVPPPEPGEFAIDQREPRRPIRLVKGGNWENGPPSPGPFMPQSQQQPAVGGPLVPNNPGEWPGDHWDGPPAPGPAPYQFYVRGEFLLWAIKQDHAPPLVTTGDFNAASFAPGNVSLPGTLTRGDTVTLFGGNITNNPFYGGRFTAGWFIDDCGDKALELGGFFLSQRGKDFKVTSAQVPFLARPFFAANQTTGGDFPREFIEVVAAPGVQAGSVHITSPSHLYGLNADLVCKACCGCDYRINVFTGPRYLNLRESLSITEDNTLIRAAANFPAGTRFVVNDTFATRNQFYGWDVGVNGRWYYGRFDLDGYARIAAGWTRQTVEINGSQVVTPPGGPVQRFQGGLLAEPSNIGSQSRDRFSVAPEMGLALGYNVTDHLRLSVGYSFLYWSSVVRPGEQIDRRLDITQIPNFTPPPATFGATLPTNPTVPQRLLRDTDFWAQGLTAGIEFRW
jgi:hypothetical protein